MRFAVVVAASLVEPVVRQPPIPVDVLRGSLLESRHVVFGALWGPSEAQTGSRSLEAWGDGALMTFMRSSLKPFQVLPLLVDGVADELGFEDAEVALAIGSHSGQAEHLAVLRGMMDKAGVDASWLRCGRHRPFHKDSARQVGEGYTVFHNNCSGKHVAMLAWCVANGVDVEGYLKPDHPLQRRILGYVSLLTGLPQVDMAVGIDGCGVPTVGLPLWAMARMFTLLARPQDLLRTNAVESLPEDEAGLLVASLDRSRMAMQAAPLMVGGEERADTDVIMATKGRIVTKAGAEGLWCGVDTASGNGFAFKAIDGNFRAAVPAALELLAARRMLHAEELPAVERHHRPLVKNHAGTLVGRIVPRP